MSPHWRTIRLLAARCWSAPAPASRCPATLCVLQTAPSLLPNVTTPSPAPRTCSGPTSMRVRDGARSTRRKCAPRSRARRVAPTLWRPRRLHDGAQHRWQSRSLSLASERPVHWRRPAGLVACPAQQACLGNRPERADAAITGVERIQELAAARERKVDGGAAARL